MGPVRAISVLAVSAALWLVATPASAQHSSVNGRPLALSAESVLLLDTQGRVLYAKNPSEDHAPASLVKLMTLYLACEAIEAGRAQWEEPVLVSHRAALTPRGYSLATPCPRGPGARPRSCCARRAGRR